MEQSSGRSWDFVGISREGWGLRDGTPPNKKKTPFEQEKNAFRARKKRLSSKKKTPFEQGKRLSSKGYLPIKCKSLQVVGVSGQGKAVASDGG